MTAGLGFGEPLALYALVVVPVVVVALWQARRSRRAALAMLGGAPALRVGVHEGRRVTSGVLLVLALVLAILAAARPQWGEEDREVVHRGIDLVIALDVSRSMEATDIAPSRAQASAAGLAAMLEHMTGNRVGLVIFAGSAFERSPLTVDLEAVSTLVGRAQADAPLVAPGTDLGVALDLALRVLDVEDRARAQVVLVVSDGEDFGRSFDGPASRAEQAGIRIYTVFAATSTPTVLPEHTGGTDATTGNPDVLGALSARTGGAAREVGQLAGLAVEFRRLQQTQFDVDAERQPVDRFAWFTGGALLLLALALAAGEGGIRQPRLRMRSGVIATALVALLLAGCGTATWRHVQAGNEAYEERRFEDALVAYERAAEETDAAAGAVHYNRANALHQLGRYEEAADAAGQALEAALTTEDRSTAALAQYTAGNVAFARQQLDEARQAYIAVLRLDDQDRDAKANLELVLSLIQPPPESEPEPEPGTEPGVGEGDGQGDGAADGAGEGEGEGDGGAPQPGEADTQPGEPSGPSPLPGRPQPGQVPPSGPEREAAIDAARVDLAQALGEVGEAMTAEQARRILELTRRLNELEGLPARSSGGGSIPPR